MPRPTQPIVYTDTPKGLAVKSNCNTVINLSLAEISRKVAEKCNVKRWRSVYDHLRNNFNNLNK